MIVTNWHSALKKKACKNITQTKDFNLLLKLADVKFQMGSKTNEGGATVMATFIFCTVYTCGTGVHLFQVLSGSLSDCRASLEKAADGYQGPPQQH